MKYIRDHYRVPAKRGGRIRFTGGMSGAVEGVIVGSRGQYLRVRFGDDIATLHPTWEVEYLT